MMTDEKLRRKASGIIIIMLVFSAVNLLCIANFTSAQTLECVTNKNDESTELSITIQSPIDQTYNSSNIALNFIVVEPASWYKPAPGYDNPILIARYGRLVSVVYTLDGMQSENMSIADANIWTIDFGTADKPVNREFSFNLTDLSSGKHRLQVTVYGLVYVSGGTTKTMDEPFSPVVTAPVVTYSQIINFTIDDSLSSPAIFLIPSLSIAELIAWIILPLAIVIALIVAVIIRRKKTNNLNTFLSLCLFGRSYI
jgi:hypothetical protein